VLNLIDTPGHVDFAYEVSRSMRAVEGSLLVVDASQGVEAQTLANVYQALDAEPRDRAGAEQDRPAGGRARPREGADRGRDRPRRLGRDPHLGQVRPRHPRRAGGDRDRLPPPKGERDKPLKAMLVDSWYDPYLGVVVLIRVMDGVIRKGDKIKMMQTGATYGVDKLAVLKPAMVDIAELGPGEIGIFTGSIKQVRDTRVGDTITHEKKPCAAPLPGFKPSSPVVFCGLFPVDANDFEDLRDAIEKLALNDASFTYEMETSAALGFGFRCGFLGLLHLEVVRDRLEREYDLDLITTAPSVVYRIHMRDGTMQELHNPADMPDLTHVDHIEEPRIRATIMVPDEYLGDVLKLCQDRRGHPGRADLCRLARHGRLRPAAERGRLRLLRPAEIGHQGLCELRLRHHRLPRGSRWSRCRCWSTRSRSTRFR
jgi:GTP-binding protein LepA